jgi:DNA replication and repair protein RecF
MIENIRLQHFRSYQDASFEFGPGVNIIVGPNGSGKTNLLEAILVLCSGSSYRVDDAELVQSGADWARLDARISGHERTVKLTPLDAKNPKSYSIDDKPFRRLTHAHTLPVVLFEPNNLLLLAGQPDMRRQYIDDLLERTDPGFGAMRRQYRRVLAQRNALLKRLSPKATSGFSAPPALDQMFVWNLRLSELGGHIAKKRFEAIEQLNAQLPDIYTSIANVTDVVTAGYVSKLPIDTYESSLLSALEKSYETDIIRGFTTYGPHRDDMAILFNGKPAGDVASRGETRTAILGLKIFELELLAAARGQRPLLLLDDVFSELDGRRRHALTTYLTTHQTFITTTDADLAITFQDERVQTIAL